MHCLHIEGLKVPRKKKNLTIRRSLWKRTLNKFMVLWNMTNCESLLRNNNSNDYFIYAILNMIHFGMQPVRQIRFSSDMVAIRRGTYGAVRSCLNLAVRNQWQVVIVVGFHGVLEANVQLGGQNTRLALEMTKGSTSFSVSYCLPRHRLSLSVCIYLSPSSEISEGPVGD